MERKRNDREAAIQNFMMSLANRSREISGDS
jgi:hypothetical protein